MGMGWKAARSLLCVRSELSESKSENQLSRAMTIPSLQELLALDKDEEGLKSPHTKRSMSTGRSSDRDRQKGFCSICLDPMKLGAGKALFTAECSHMFHFSCIASNVRHGNRICPVCRAKWVDLPWSNPAGASAAGSASVSSGNHQVDPVLGILNETLASSLARLNRSRTSIVEPSVYDDDEALSISNLTDSDSHQASRFPTISAFSETSAVQANESRSPFTVLINIKAPSRNSSNSVTDRAPIDLVTLLDVSGSMAGAKLALLKSAVEFVISQLGPRDRLCVISFATSANRLFPLKRMDDANKRRAVRSVQTLAAAGGTNIRDGLRKAVKVLADRRHRNTVSSVILLSDGQDTSAYFSNTPVFSGLHRGTPVHTFGFGSDHDATTLHGIAEVTHGTFSFVRAAASVREAFAQCIGGLLSVVSQRVEVRLQTAAGSNASKILRIENGGFDSQVSEDGFNATVGLGDLYAEEERDILVQIDLRSRSSTAESVELLKIGCGFSDALQPDESLETEPYVLSMPRPVSVQASAGNVSLEVDRQRNRLFVSKSIAKAGVLADTGNLSAAQQTIVECRRKIHQSAAFLSGDSLSKALLEELGEVSRRMENRRIYEESGRAFALSAHSSHSHQRATMRHDADVYGQSYQTASMAEMVHLSQTFGGGKSSNSSSRTRIGRSRSSRRVNPS